MSIAEKAALDRLNKRFGGRVKTHGFRTAVKDAGREDIDEGEVDWFRRIPDGFMVLEDPELGLTQLVAIEIEHTHHLTKDKLRDYAEFWFLLDCTETCHLMLLVVDRYDNLNAISLMHLWYELHASRQLVEAEAGWAAEKTEWAAFGVRYLDDLCVDDLCVSGLRAAA